MANSFNFSYGFERPLKITGEGNQNVEKIVTYDSELRPDEVTVEVALAKLQTDSIVQDSQCVDFNKLGEQYLKQYLDNVNVLTTSR